MKGCTSTNRIPTARSAQNHLRPIVVLSFLSLLHGCSILPGMFVVPNKDPIVTKANDESAEVDYALYKVTPALIHEQHETQKLAEKTESNINGLPKSSSHPYQLGSQDVLRIFVWGNPDLTPVITSVTSNVASTPAGRVIDDNGYIYFPLVGNIKAAGLTLSGFREALSKRLSKYIKDPQVEVEIAGFRSQKVFVSGQVRTPGVIPITDQPLRITDAIGQAGGATDSSDLYSVVLTRGNANAKINLDKLYYSGDVTANILLQNGDIISIPDRQLRKVFVLGEVGNAAGVNQARSYVMRRGQMTLTEVLSDAGGASPFSSAANEIYVMRLGNQGKPIVYVLDAAQPQNLLLAEQFFIQPRDVIFVNPTGPTMIGRFIGQFLPIIQSVNSVTATPF